MWLYQLLESRSLKQCVSCSISISCISDGSYGVDSWVVCGIVFWRVEFVVLDDHL